MIDPNALDSHIQSNLEASLTELSLLCSQPSVSAAGEGLEECANLVHQMLSKRGFIVERPTTGGYPVIVARRSGNSERTLLLYNHYDVQPPDPLESWTSPPFEPQIRDGALYARGAEDDKGEFIARLAAVDAVLAVNDGQLPCNITFVVEGEEEIGSPNIAQFVLDHKELLACNGAVWEVGGVDKDDRPIVTTGLRGILGVRLSVKTMSRDAHSGGGHILPSAAWRLLWALNSLKGPDERILINGFYDDVLGPSALDLSHLADFSDPEAHIRKSLEIESFAGNRKGRELLSSVFEPTCNIQGITTGYQGNGIKTIVPAEARATLDFRLVPGQDPDEVFRLLRVHLDNNGFRDVICTKLGSMLPSKVTPDDSFVQLTAETAAEVYGQEALIDPLAGGSSPVYAFAKPLGDIPVVTAGVGYSDNRIHSPDEHVRIKDFERGARHLARIIERFDSLA